MHHLQVEVLDARDTRVVELSSSRGNYWGCHLRHGFAQHVRHVVERSGEPANFADVVLDPSFLVRWMLPGSMNNLGELLTHPHQPLTHSWKISPMRVAVQPCIKMQPFTTQHPGERVTNLVLDWIGIYPQSIHQLTDMQLDTFSQGKPAIVDEWVTGMDRDFDATPKTTPGFIAARD